MNNDVLDIGFTTIALMCFWLLIMALIWGCDKDDFDNMG